MSSNTQNIKVGDRVRLVTNGGFFSCRPDLEGYVSEVRGHGAEVLVEGRSDGERGGLFFYWREIEKIGSPVFRVGDKVRLVTDGGFFYHGCSPGQVGTVVAVEEDGVDVSGMGDGTPQIRGRLFFWFREVEKIDEPVFKVGDLIRRTAQTRYRAIPVGAICRVVVGPDDDGDLSVEWGDIPHGLVPSRDAELVEEAAVPVAAEVTDPVVMTIPLTASKVEEIEKRAAAVRTSPVTPYWNGARDFSDVLLTLLGLTVEETTIPAQTTFKLKMENA